MDVLAITDFPDIRLKAAIQSADEGSVLIIPREGGYLFRLSILELDKLNEDKGEVSESQHHDRSSHRGGEAPAILHPYALDVKEIAWHWSVYEIGQRLCDAGSTTWAKTRRWTAAPSVSHRGRRLSTPT